VGVLNTIGERIRYYRERKGWSQPELAKACSIGQDRISKIENGRSNAYFWEVERLALYLEVPLGWLDTVRHRLEREKQRPAAPEPEQPAPPGPSKRPKGHWPTGPEAGAV
jgi:transcriptional regulator with XRE-family HTH domain